MNLSPRQRRLLHWCGSGLALAAILSVGFRLHSYALELDFSRMSPLAWGFVGGLSVVYGAANLLLVMAWWHLLNYCNAPVSRLEAVRVFGKSQLAKYVPGNIFHLAGRQALGMAGGMAPGALARSMGWELSLLVVAGAQFGWLILPLWSPAFREPLSALCLLASAMLTATVLRRVFHPQVGFSFLWQMLFLVISGSVFVSLLAVIAGGAGLAASHWLAVGGAYIAAWLLGLVTPGAPAGLGVREYILLFLLKGMVGDADLLMCVLLGRLVTSVGDLLFFVAANALPSDGEKIHAAE